MSRFTIRYETGGRITGYKVSIPNYDGGEVVTADEYDALRDELQRTRKDNALLRLGLDKTFESRAREFMKSELGRLRKALELIYDKYEDGDNCFENPEELEGYIGNAIRLSKEEEDEILALIPKSRALNPQPTEKGAAVLGTCHPTNSMETRR